MGWMWNSPAIAGSWTPAGTDDSAFDGDVDIAIGLVYAALQWPDEYTDIAIAWLKGMECEINPSYDDGLNYPTAGDSQNKNYCDANTCEYTPGTSNHVFIDYYPPGYFRVFGDFMAAKLGREPKAYNGQSHRDFWYRTAKTVYELIERCYDSGAHPGMVGDLGTITNGPCASPGGGTGYEELRELWRVGIDARVVRQQHRAAGEQAQLVSALRPEVAHAGQDG